MLDWIPTADEVFRKLDCTLSCHNWITYVDEETREPLYRICESCGKKEEN